MMANEDRRTIGLTSETQRLLEEIQAKAWFGEAQDVARFAFAYAIKNGVAPGLTNGVETRWAVGNFDSTGEMLAVVSSLFPNAEMPVRTIEHFVNEGLRLVHARLVTGAETPADLLG